MSSPLPATVTVTASGQVGLLIQPCVTERHKLTAQKVILEDVPAPNA
ncbi:hypothetical protein [Streptomyces sp. NPDC002692]